MCTLFLAIGKHPEFPVILIENRDEFYKRKSLKPHWWDGENLFAGKDLEKGGTWLGYHKNGNWGVVTNYRDLTKPIVGERSRGDLIPTIIGGDFSIEESESFLLKNGQLFGPFNLMYSINNQLFCYSSELNKVEELKPGIYGLSNAYLDTPWFKIKRGKKKFIELIEKTELSKERLFTMMQDNKQASDAELPDTGLPNEVEKLVSSLFIKSKDYGTHCTTLLLKNGNGEIDFTEKRFV